MSDQQPSPDWRARLKSLMSADGRSIQQLANDAGISRSVLYSLTSADQERSVNLSTLESVLHELGHSLEDFFGAAGGTMQNSAPNEDALLGAMLTSDPRLLMAAPAEINRAYEETGLSADGDREQDIKGHATLILLKFLARAAHKAGKPVDPDVLQAFAASFASQAVTIAHKASAAR